MDYESSCDCSFVTGISPDCPKHGLSDKAEEKRALEVSFAEKEQIDSLVDRIVLSREALGKPTTLEFAREIALKALGI